MALTRHVWIAPVISLALGCQAQLADEQDEPPPDEPADARPPVTTRSDAAVARPPADGPAATPEAAVVPAPARDAGEAGGGATADAAPAASCAPTAGGPYWLEEGGTVTATVRCGTGRALPGDAFTIGDLPRGASYDPARASLTWRTGLDAAGVYLLKITARPSNETGELKIGVADKFDDPANVPVRDFTNYTEEFGLPVMHLQPSPDFEQKLALLRARQNAYWTDPCKPLCVPSLYAPVTITYRGRTYKAEGHYRGASSSGYPKKNYTLKFPKEDKFTEPVFAGGGMRNRRRIALITTFDDNSYVRWRLAFELWNRVDPNIIRIGHFSTVVYLNGRYHGLYAVSDKIDDNMMQRNQLAEEGNLYMAIDHNGNFDTLARQQGGPNAGMVRPRNCPFEGFKKKEGLPEQCNGTTFVPSAFDDLLPFLDLVAKADDARFRAEIGKTIMVSDYVSWFVHATAIMASDSYAKNALHYHDPVTKGPWRVIVWDYNASFGQAWNTVRSAPTADPISIANSSSMPARNNLWKRLWNDPTHQQMMRSRYAAALKDQFKAETVLALYDELVKEISASARRDERRWGAQYRSYYGPTSGAKRMDLLDHAGEVAYTRKWIADRWAYLRTVFP